MTEALEPSSPVILASGDVKIPHVDEMGLNREILVGDGSFIADPSVASGEERRLIGVMQERNPRRVLHIVGLWTHNRGEVPDISPEVEENPEAAYTRAVLTIDFERRGVRRKVTGKYAVTVTLFRKTDQQ